MTTPTPDSEFQRRGRWEADLADAERESHDQAREHLARILAAWVAILAAWGEWDGWDEDADDFDKAAVFKQAIDAARKWVCTDD